MARPRKPVVTLNMSREEAEIVMLALFILNVDAKSAAIAKKLVTQMAQGRCSS